MISGDEPAVIREVHTAESTGGLYPTADYDETTWRRYLWGYYRLVEKVDAEMMKVLEALQATGQVENTVIIFISDHGEGMAAHHWNQKCILYNEVANIPCLVSFKGTTPGGRVNSTHLISPAMDIYPTVLDLAGVSVPEDLDGWSLEPFIMDKDVKDWRDYVVLQNDFNVYHRVSSRAIISGNHKYIAYNKDGQPAGEQFFDMVNDPGEMLNLSGDPEYAGQVAHSKKLLRDWQEDQGDRGFSLPGNW
jgi:arylsulfatase A-like enzyme